MTGRNNSNPIASIMRVLFPALLLLIINGFFQSSSALSQDHFTILSKQQRITLHLQVAEGDQDRAKGLMQRQSIAPYDGMLFIFAQTQPVSMWMKNTPLSLDMLFIGEGGIIRRIVTHTTPFSTDVIESRSPVRYVIELIAGETERLGINEGDRLIVPHAN